ncbi:MAG TPA: response regulator, partial [Nitrospirota bacterium]
DGFRVVAASDGVEALRKASELRPQGMVLDVGLPGIYGFELCERLKADPVTKSIKIVLLSSVYDMRRYKRTPVSLYGADDYIEKHHIPDFLGLKLRRLIYPEAFAGKAPKGAELPHDELPEMSRLPAREFDSSLLSQEQQPPAGRDIGVTVPRPAVGARQQQADSYEAAPILPVSISLDSSVFQKEECDIPPVREEDPEAVEKARRFARIIVSDVALYNQEAVVEGIRKGNFFELLKTDVEEGRELFEKRVPASIRAKRDYYQEAFDNFIAAARKRTIR